MAFAPHEIEWTAEKSTRLWDYYAANAAHRKHFFGLIAGGMVARRIDRHVGFAGLSRILDLSCGPGDLMAACLPYLRSGQTVTGTDFSARNVALAAARFAGNPRVQGIQHVTSFPSPLPPRNFDLVVSTEVVEHLDDQELAAMLAECRRVLKADGRLFVTTPNAEDYEGEKTLCPDCGCIFHRWQHVRTWTAATLEAAMTAGGFATRRIEAVAWQSRLGQLARRLARRPVIDNGLVYIGAPR